MDSRIVVSAVFVLLLLIAPQTNGAFAQSFGAGGVENEGMAFNRFVRPGEATIQLWVISDTRSGLYEVGESVSLGELVVLTGTGPGMTTARERRRTDVKVYRGQGSTRDLVYDATLEEMVQEPGRYPALQSGDVVMMETHTSQRFQWRDALTIVSAVSTSILLIDRIRRL